MSKQEFNIFRSTTHIHHHGWICSSSLNWYTTEHSYLLLKACIFTIRSHEYQLLGEYISTSLSSIPFIQLMFQTGADIVESRVDFGVLCLFPLYEFHREREEVHCRTPLLLLHHHDIPAFNIFDHHFPAVKIAGDVYDYSSSYTTDDAYHPTSLDMIDDILQIVPDICCRLSDSSSTTKCNSKNGLSWMDECTTMSFPEACPSLVVPFAVSSSSSSKTDVALGTCATSAPENLMVAAATDFLMSASDVSIPSVSTDVDYEEEDIGDFLIDAPEWLL